MNDSKNTTILLLTITAAILTAILVSAYMMDGEAAYAGSSESRQGQYILGTGQYSKNMDLVYVIDVENQALITYAPNTNRRTVETIGRRIDLESVFGGR